MTENSIMRPSWLMGMTRAMSEAFSPASTSERCTMSRSNSPIRSTVSARDISRSLNSAARSATASFSPAPS
ncbi:hypothetical protein ACU4GG_42285 [Streptomyces nojiriensis]